jgi:hypothetical protein
LISGGRIVLAANGFAGIQTDSPRTTIEGSEVVGPGGSGGNFRVEATATQSAIIDVRSRDPFGAGHISYAAGAGPGHIVSGGMFDSSAGKQLIATGGGTTAIQVTGQPRGTNMTAISNASAGVTTAEIPAAFRAVNTVSAGDMDRVFLSDATAAARTVTLPNAVNVGAGKEYIVKKKDASANTVTVATTSAQTIDGASTVVLAAQGAICRVVSDGAIVAAAGDTTAGAIVAGAFGLVNTVLVAYLAREQVRTRKVLTAPRRMIFDAEGRPIGTMLDLRRVEDWIPEEVSP